jgi:hypothetical protein
MLKAAAPTLNPKIVTGWYWPPFLSFRYVPFKANNKVVPVSQTEGCGFKSPRILNLQFSN